MDSRRCYKKNILPFSWRSRREAEVNANAICHCLVHLLGGVSERKVAFIWSAGKAGFGASEEEMLDELASYNIVLELANRVAELPLAPEVFFHHFSSAGGLFEGQCLSDRGREPSPKRSYGQIKYEQEKKLEGSAFFSVKNIYRPTSIYGVVKKNHRMGLIQALLSNGIRNRVTAIFGNLNTLRDYVLNDDIGKYVYMRLFDKSNGAYSVFFLGGGKPSSIYEVKHVVEDLLGRKIYIRYKQNKELANDKDIIISSAVMPKDWYPSDLRFGVSLVKNAMLLS